MKSVAVGARIEPELKNRAESIFHRLGLNAAQAITIFYQQVDLCNGLPFDVVLPNEVTSKTLSDSEAGYNLVVCENAEDMFDKLGV